MLVPVCMAGAPAPREASGLGEEKPQSCTLQLRPLRRQERSSLGELKAAIYICMVLETLPFAYNAFFSHPILSPSNI